MFRIFWGSSSSEFSKHLRPQNFLRILSNFWGWGSSRSSSENLKKSSSSEFSEGPQNFHSISVFLFENTRFFLAHFINKTLIEWKFKGSSGNWGWQSSENSEDEDPQKILRMMILRKFWGCSENSEDDDPQKILMILRKFWGWRSSENSEDEDPLRMLRKFWGWRSSENSDDPQKVRGWGSSGSLEILRMTILRKFWGWWSSENSEGDDPRKILKIFEEFWGWRSSENSQESLDFLTIIRKSVNDKSTNHRIYPVFVRTTILAKTCFSKSKVKQEARPIVYTDNTQCFICSVCFSLTIKAIFIFLIDHNIMIIINCMWFSVIRYIQWLSEWWPLANLIFKGKNKHKACRYFVYTQHALFYLLCLPLFSCPKLPDACRENDILIKIFMISFKRSDAHL